MTSWFSSWFTRRRSSGAEPRATLAFGFRGEGITYRLGERVLELEFSHGGGPRVYAEGFTRWRDGTRLSDAEAEQAFAEVVRFIHAAGPKAIVVINADDPLAPTWERLCAANRRHVARAEHTSDEQQFQFERSMYLQVLQAGKGLTIDDTRITTEQELDDFLGPRRRSRRP